MRKVLLTLATIGVLSHARAQVKVGDNPTNVDASAVLEAESSTKGFLPPRMTTAQRNAISNPANGLVIFNTTSNSLEVNTGTPASPAWTVYAPTNVYNADGTLTGNRTVTMNGNNLAFSGTGNVGIGTTAPGYRLDLGSSFGNSATDVAGKKLAVYNDNTTFYGLGVSGGTLQFHAESSPNEAPGMVLNGTGNVGIGTTSPDASAMLEMNSTGRGMLIPRMTASQRDAINNPAHALLIFNTTEGCINIYNEEESKWKSVCGEEAGGTAVFTADCSSLLVSGTYATGVALDPDANYITLSVDVSDTGTYSIVANSGGMYFSDAGSFTTTGIQEITLKGQGYPLVSGSTFIALNIGGDLCTTVINVSNGLATVTNCGSSGTLTGSIIANQAIDPGTVYQSYATGPAYTGGAVFGLTSAITNGIRIYNPTNGAFSGSGAAIDYLISGTPLQPGSTTINYSINGFACSFSVPVQSGTGRASSVNCGGALSGTYQVGTGMTAGNTKQITLNVSTAGTFYIRTNTANGIYFSGSATLSAGSNQPMTLYASGTPESNTSATYTVTASSSATAFVTCTFNVTATLPATVPAYNTLTCGSFSNSVSYIKANNTGAGDMFGSEITLQYDQYGKQTKISADGLTLAVGAIREDGDLTGGAINSTNNNSWSDAGAVYIYKRTSISSAWTFQAKLKPTQLGTTDVFGNALDLSDDGNTLVVGSRGEDGSGTGVNPSHNDNAPSSGAAYVFVRNGSTWSQEAYIKASNTGADCFGASVAISGDGNTVAVGAPLEDGGNSGINPASDEAKKDAGAVYTYTRSGSVWTFEAYLKAANPDAGDKFGCSLALNNNGTTLAVGAFNEDGGNTGINPIVNNSLANSGAAYVFQKNASVWAQQAYIKSGNVSANDNFGFSLEIDGSGDKLIVGAPYEDGNGTNVNPGANESASNSGAAYIFSRTGSSWSQSAYLKSINTGSSDEFGRAVSISGNGEFAAVGAWGEDGSGSCVNPNSNNSAIENGAGYLYSLVSGAWTPSFTFKGISGASSYDRNGACVSVSADGRTFVMGTGWEDGSGSGINPSANNSASGAGCVVVYTK